MLPWRFEMAEPSAHAVDAEHGAADAQYWKELAEELLREKQHMQRQA